MKLLYLDYDGVLHDRNVYYSRSRGIYITTPSRYLFEWMHILEELLEPHPDVKIVLSTSWTTGPGRGYDFAKAQLSPALQERVIGDTIHRTDIEDEDGMQLFIALLLGRGLQVTDDVKRRKPESWFAIDDDGRGWPEEHLDRLILTDGSTGLSDERIQHAIIAMLEKF